MSSTSSQIAPCTLPAVSAHRKIDVPVSHDDVIIGPKVSSCRIELSGVKHVHWSDENNSPFRRTEFESDIPSKSSAFETKVLVPICQISKRIDRTDRVIQVEVQSLSSIVPDLEAQLTHVLSRAEALHSDGIAAMNHRPTMVVSCAQASAHVRNDSEVALRLLQRSARQWIREQQQAASAWLNDASAAQRWFDQVLLGVWPQLRLGMVDSVRVPRPAMEMQLMLIKKQQQQKQQQHKQQQQQAAMLSQSPAAHDGGPANLTPISKASSHSSALSIAATSSISPVHFPVAAPVEKCSAPLSPLSIPIAAISVSVSTPCVPSPVSSSTSNHAHSRFVNQSDTLPPSAASLSKYFTFHVPRSTDVNMSTVASEFESSHMPSASSSSPSCLLSSSSSSPSAFDKSPSLDSLSKLQSLPSRLDQARDLFLLEKRCTLSQRNPSFASSASSSSSSSSRSARSMSCSPSVSSSTLSLSSSSSSSSGSDMIMALSVIPNQRLCAHVGASAQLRQLQTQCFDILPARLQRLHHTVSRGTTLVDRLSALMNSHCSPTYRHHGGGADVEEH